MSALTYAFNCRGGDASSGKSISLKDIEHNNEPDIFKHVNNKRDGEDDQYNAESYNPTRSLTAFSCVVHGTVLFADISGFTKLATKLSCEHLKIHIK